MQSPDQILPDSGYRSNKTSLMNNVAAGGWAVAWSDDITETDAGEGIVAAGVSIATDEPGPFMAWIQDLIDRTIDTLEDSAQQVFPTYLESQLETLAADAIRAAVQGNSENNVLRSFDTLDFKAGCIAYSGGNFVLGNNVAPTGGLKPYVGIRWRGSANNKAGNSNPGPSPGDPSNPGPTPMPDPGTAANPRIDFTIVNLTQYKVSFNLGSNNFVLNSQQTGNYWSTEPNPTVNIVQLDGTTLSFRLADKGSYAFQVDPQSGKIENYYH